MLVFCFSGKNAPLDIRIHEVRVIAENVFFLKKVGCEVLFLRWVRFEYWFLLIFFDSLEKKFIPGFYPLSG